MLHLRSHFPLQGFLTIPSYLNSSSTKTFKNKSYSDYSTSKINFPFTRFVGQEELKLVLCLVMVDPNIGGVLIKGDRGVGKSVIVRSLVDVHPELDVVPGDPFNSSPIDPSLMGPDVLARF